MGETLHPTLLATRNATHLCRQHDEGGTNHADHEELRRPDVRLEVAVADGRQCHHHEIEAFEQVHVLYARTLKVLEAAHTARRATKKRHATALLALLPPCDFTANYLYEPS